MFFFNKKAPALADSGIFSGMTDWHSHILPGVDDGFQTIDQSLAALDRLGQLGVKRIWLTPHIMEDYPNTPENLRQRFDQLSGAYNGPVQLRLAAEHMLDNLFEKRLSQGILMPIGDEQRHLLVETSYYTPPMRLDGMLDDIRSAGFFPVLAHPERYRYMEHDDYKRLQERDILFQINIMSLLGGYGETARKKAEWLLSQEMAHLTGTDLHRLDTLEAALPRRAAKASALKALCRIASAPAIN